MSLTIEHLLDIEEIKQAKYLYSHYYDGGEVDKAVDLFTEDAVCEFGPRYGDWVGRDQIHEKYSGIWANNRANGGLPYEVLHAFTNPHIVLTGPETAQGWWYLLEFTTRAGAESPPRIFGVYRDDYRKVGGRWKIARMRVDFLWPIRAFKGEEAV
ncbi:nuclear transport factor 2 family protein [Emcibacter sp. SYSU 3D8]|uniref:nuclear transport factor 2 family protein n=1 Tax=Emcibacter sp. SYSU 3D8 TaxID=3133969 RepID=UPI0031FE4EB0